MKYKTENAGRKLQRDIRVTRTLAQGYVKNIQWTCVFRYNPETDSCSSHFHIILHSAKYKRLYNQRLRLKAIDKLGGKCERCGEADPRVLQFNHLNGGGFTERKVLRIHNFLKSVISGERSDINLLCANCNILYDYERGIRKWEEEV